MAVKFFKSKAVFKLINFLTLIFIALGLALLFGRTGWWPSYYNPLFYGWAFLLSAVLMNLPRLIFKTDAACKSEAVNFLSFALALALTLNLLGELYLYRLYLYGFQYDKFIHLGNSFIFLLALAFGVRFWRELDLKKSVLFALAIVIIGSLAWELIEFSSDWLFKTNEFGIYGQFKFLDTVFDLLFDLLGAISGVIFLASPALNNFLNRLFSQNCRQSLPDKF